MKKAALQLALQIVNYNKQYIRGNIAEYLLPSIDMDVVNFFQYLTEEEVESYDGVAFTWQHTEEGEELESMIRDNFDYNIEEFEY